MEQFSVQVPGSINSKRWSFRVLSVSPHRGVASVSASDSADKWSHRSLRVTRVELWPNYNSKYVSLPHNSIEAQLTLLLRGESVRLDNQEVRQYGRVQRVLGFMQTRRHSKAQAWAVQFSDFSSFQKAVLLFMKFKGQTVQENSTEGDSKATAQATTNPLQTKETINQNSSGIEKPSSASQTIINTTNPSNAVALTSETDSSKIIEGDVESALKRIRALWNASEERKLMI